LYPLSWEYLTEAGEKSMSSVTGSVTLTILDFPDITGAALKAWLLVTVNSGTYTTGGIPMGLVLWADQHTVDFHCFLRALLNTDNPYVAGSTGEYTYRYNPVTDSLQIFGPGTLATGPGGAELAAGAIPAEVLADSIVCEAVWNRTTTLG
jgi:hypothetical protein